MLKLEKFCFKNTKTGKSILLDTAGPCVLVACE